DTEIVGSAMATLRIMFGENIPDPVDYQITRWASDPYAMGSYSFNAVGSVPLMRTELARSVSNRLFFAGEASDRSYFGTAHGAYLSGLRAAGEVMSV
ncbi:MAG: FAD-dependent oxidoreductase, partial [Acidobacteriota bacterium]